MSEFVSGQAALVSAERDADPYRFAIEYPFASQYACPGAADNGTNRPIHRRWRWIDQKLYGGDSEWLPDL